MVDPRLFQALSDRTRLDILSLLAGGTINVSRIVAHLGCAQPAVSRHLRVLREASLISDRRKGKEVEYSIKPAALKAAAAYLADIIEPVRSRAGARKPQHVGPAATPKSRHAEPVSPSKPAASRASGRGPRKARDSGEEARRRARRAGRQASRAPARDFAPEEAEFKVKPKPKSGLDDFLL